ncbi:hypothetical protein QR685DRAFT_64332 [Neurospora intermedia]|uniref:Uncharacterized protein n=1 Tax=Neurospora intermedia TaxID=5142 RepID=A0ABR3DTC4_NEUIN
MSQPQPCVFTWEHAIELSCGNRKVCEHGRGDPASPATSRATLRAGFDVDNNDDNNNNNKKRPATDHGDFYTPNGTPRVKTETDSNATNFTVHAKGPYTVRVLEGNIPVAEFSFSTPATVQVKMVQKSAAPAAVIDLDESDN